jgi:hypothetical protein
VLLAVGGVGAFDFVGAVGKEGDRGVPGGVVGGGVMVMKVFPVWFRSLSSMNSPSSEGSSIWSPFSVSAL